MKTKPKTLEVITGWPEWPQGSGKPYVGGDYHSKELVIDGKVVLSLNSHRQVDAWVYGKLPKVKQTNVLSGLD